MPDLSLLCRILTLPQARNDISYSLYLDERILSVTKITYCSDRAGVSSTLTATWSEEGLFSAGAAQIRRASVTLRAMLAEMRCSGEMLTLVLPGHIMPLRTSLLPFMTEKEAIRDFSDPDIIADIASIPAGFSSPSYGWRFIHSDEDADLSQIEWHFINRSVLDVLLRLTAQAGCSLLRLQPEAWALAHYARHFNLHSEDDDAVALVKWTEKNIEILLIAGDELYSASADISEFDLILLSYHQHHLPVSPEHNSLQESTDPFWSDVALRVAEAIDQATQYCLRQFSEQGGLPPSHLNLHLFSEPDDFDADAVISLLNQYLRTPFSRLPLPHLRSDDIGRDEDRLMIRCHQCWADAAAIGGGFGVPSPFSEAELFISLWGMKTDILRRLPPLRLMDQIRIIRRRMVGASGVFCVLFITLFGAVFWPEYMEAQKQAAAQGIVSPEKLEAMGATGDDVQNEIDILVQQNNQLASLLSAGLSSAQRQDILSSIAEYLPAETRLTDFQLQRHDQHYRVQISALTTTRTRATLMAELLSASTQLDDVTVSSDEDEETGFLRVEITAVLPLMTTGTTG